MVLFPNPAFSLQPDVFYRILLWGVGSEASASDLPIVFTTVMTTTAKSQGW